MTALDIGLVSYGNRMSVLICPEKSFWWWCGWLFVLTYFSYCISKFADLIYSFGGKLRIYSSRRQECTSWLRKK